MIYHSKGFAPTSFDTKNPITQRGLIGQLLADIALRDNYFDVNDMISTYGIYAVDFEIINQMNTEDCHFAEVKTFREYGEDQTFILLDSMRKRSADFIAEYNIKNKTDRKLFWIWVNVADATIYAQWDTCLNDVMVIDGKVYPRKINFSQKDGSRPATIWHKKYFEKLKTIPETYWHLLKDIGSNNSNDNAKPANTY